MAFILILIHTQLKGLTSAMELIFADFIKKIYFIFKLG